jgi:uncharacterized repeat protein (TIGR03803 family)
MKSVRGPANVCNIPIHSLATLCLVLFILFFAAGILNAQTPQAAGPPTYNVLYNFTGGTDGGSPSAGVVFDQAGNLYGTTRSGGAYGHGTVYKLSPSEGGWNETVLYSFTGGPDGDSPYGGVIFDQAGNLWGTTYQGGDPGCHCGTVFELSPLGGGWTFNLTHAFLGGSDGAYPMAGLVSTYWGEMYGTTSQGGSQSCGYVGCGTIYLTGPGYLLWNVFSPTGTGIQPQSAMFYDEPRGGYLGTTVWGPDGTGWGTIFAEYDNTIYTLHTFSLKGTAGFNPLAGVVVDSAGNVYGTTSTGFANHGTVFEIHSTLKVLHQFLGADGSEPAGDLLLDAPGNIYGTTFAGGATGKGVLFKLTPGLLQKWTETVLHSFAGSDGANPLTSLVFDGADNLYGTTNSGGTSGAGVVFQMQNVRVGPKAALSPTLSLTFGNQVINTTSTAKTVTLSNTGDEILAISSITANGNFAVSSNTCGTTLALGAQCKVSVTFTPTVVYTQRGALTFTDNAPTNPQTMELWGTGVLPATLTPGGLLPQAYTPQAVGTTSAPKTFTLTNNQPVTLNGIAISTTGDFAVSATTCTASLPAKSKCTISVTFTPTLIGTRTGGLSVNDSAANSPQTVALSGKGVLPVSLTPSSATFTQQTVGTTSSPKTFTLTNNLNATIDIAISTAGDFHVSTTTCATSLAAKSQCAISVAFTPTAIGTRTGKLSVNDTASNSPQTSALVGTGK